jgi:4-carboxymuconolactone decarboxylase
MSRLEPLEEATLDDAQRAFVEALQSGPRGKLGLVGPFGVWARSPKVGTAIQALGAVARFESALPEDAKEVAICTVGAHYRAKFEFGAHGPMAIAAGVPETVVEAIRTGAAPSFADDAQAMAYRVAQSLLVQHRLDSDTYDQALALFGESTLIELVTLVGYYGLVSLTLNAFEVPLAPTMSDPFP